MSLSVRLGLLSLALLLPGSVLAAPGIVTGVTATLDGTNVRVSWQPLPGDIAAYRIFFSHASILQNGGLFDDFETVDGSVTTHVLRSVPPVRELTVAVLAVDSRGAESPFFVEEATVRLPDTSAPRLDPAPVLEPGGPLPAPSSAAASAPASSAAPAPAPAPPAAPAQPLPAPAPSAADVTGLTLRAQPAGALFVVEAYWQAVTNATGYEVRQTIDGGRSFGPVFPVPAGTTAVRIPGVVRGTFGLHVRAVLADGTRTRGSTQVLDLSGIALPGPLTGQAQPQPIIPAPTEGRGSLPGSGPAPWLLTMLAGAIVGLTAIRRRMRAAAQRT